jgi:diadenylate cyclase
VISSELLLNIFWPNSPLHDGAVIIHGERVVAAGVVLPLSQSPTNEHMGTRHRAAIGITEISDAIAVVVSEETGTISLANAGRMVRNLGEARLQKVLSILDRSSAGFGNNGRPPGLLGLSGLGRLREHREKAPEPPQKGDDSEPDAA